MKHPANDVRGKKSEKLKGKTIVIGITGSIAAVETVKICRELIRHGAKIVPVMSKNACEIIHPYAIEFATGMKPILELTGKIEHVLYCGEREEKANLFLISPCTANTLSKIALGIDDTPVTTFATTAIGSKIPVMVVPAMHKSMYEHPFITENIKKLKEKGIHILQPRIEEGKAKIADNEEIVENVIRILGKNDLRNKRILIIGGATSEFIDDVRVITNLSSGKMAIALAKTAYERGGDVKMWYDKDALPYVSTKKFTSHKDLLKFVDEERKYDIIINCAAISDFTPKKRKGKIPSGEKMDLHLLPVPRINPLLKKIGNIVIGFKLEVKEKGIEERAYERLKKDSLDFIVANTTKSIGSDYMKAWIIDKDKNVIIIKGKKEEIAEKIFDCIA
ncbi:MAG: bifunctional phosphopantothenoylcysteine decarboxylase/phosphopantothenate--cysteine ligase CoaBC [Thermoplasmata archaeon]|nr:MAG: bifunctional phosphopantothenoylcysteine decarboxylase/phosphopantothenate--cysteine ligase CoaBC [Thermoplasmata archaeon]